MGPDRGIPAGGACFLMLGALDARPRGLRGSAVLKLKTRLQTRRRMAQRHRVSVPGPHPQPLTLFKAWSFEVLT